MQVNSTLSLPRNPKPSRNKRLPSAISWHRKRGRSLKSHRKSFPSSRSKKKRLTIQDGDQTFHVAIDDEDAPKLLPLILFVKTFDWKRYAIPIRTEEAGVPYWFGKAIGKPKRATPWDVSKSGGDIEEGWWVIPIQWYESVKSKEGTYYLSKNRHMLDMRSVHLAPQGITLIEHAMDKKTKHYTVKKEDHEMLMEFIASS